jgi:hypothetical protein
VNTIFSVAQQYGALDGLRQKLGGAEPGQASQDNAAMAQHVKRLEAQVAQFTPERLQEMILSAISTNETEKIVSGYETRDHWQDAVGLIPAMIPVVQQRLGEGASITDILDAAYDMAVHANPDLRAKVTAAAKAPAAHDPKRTEAARKAKSVNVVATSSGKARELSDRDRMLAVYNKLTAE